ncbi:MAG: hypothetical protein ACI9T7_000183 [Oleiphilaceae bacterium]|jgi:hypothetical protein
MNLQLALKSEYFDAIKSGEKTEEYRLCTPYWEKRLVNRDYEQIILTKGYPKRNDESRRMYFQYYRYEIKTITHPHFGSEPVKVFAIKVGKELVSDFDLELYRAGMLD